MAAQTTPDFEERLKRVEEFVSAKEKARLERYLPGITFLSIIAFAFWLGGLTSSLRQQSEKLDKVYAITLESKDSLSSRVSAVEARLDSIDKKLDSIDGKLSAGGK